MDHCADAINKSHVFGFLNKPCSTDSPIQSIESGEAPHHRLQLSKAFARSALAKSWMQEQPAGSTKLADVGPLTPVTTLDSRKMGRWAGF